MNELSDHCKAKTQWLQIWCWSMLYIHATWGIFLYSGTCLLYDTSFSLIYTFYSVFFNLVLLISHFLIISGSEIARCVWTSYPGRVLWLTDALRSVGWAQWGLAHFHTAFARDWIQTHSSNSLHVRVTRSEGSEYQMQRKQLQILRLIQMETTASRLLS